MKQYEDNPSAAKMTVVPASISDKRLTGRITELEQKVAAHEAELLRVHRDIIRLREIINQVSARIKS